MEAFADRHEIDWEAALTRARGASQRAVLANLRRLARVARRPESPSLPASRGALARDPSRSLASWEWAVVLLAGGHVALGLLGGLFGVPDELPLPVWVPMLGLPCAAAAAWLLVVGREDRRAERLGGAFLLAGAAFAMRPATWLLGAGSALLAATPDAFGGVFLWNFAREFPRPRKLSRQERWLDVGARVATLLATALFFANLAGHWVPLPGALRLLLREHPGSLYWYVVLVTGGAALLLSMARTRSAATLERERFALFLGGILLGLGPLFLEVLTEAGSSSFADWMSRPSPTFWGGALFFVFLCAMAAVTSYAVASWRMFGVRLLIRRALIRWLVRTALVIVIFALPVVAYELVTGRPLVGELPSGRATAVLLLLLVGVVLTKDPIVRFLDRTIFRDALTHEHRVEDLTDRLRLARSLAELEAELEAILGVVIGARHVILFAEHRLSRSASFRPARGRGYPLPAASPLATLACEGGLPLPTAPGESGSSYHWLSPDDQAWLGEHDLALLAPIRDSSGEVIALIGVGPRRGGRSYGDDELLLVRDLAVTLSIIIENLKLRTGSGELPTLAFECDACGRVSPESGDACECGERRWSPARLPYRFADKFRLERVLGRGGMGVVYRGMDETLQRRVALKTLPRVGRRDAQRLREEARRMASIDHPHLARIHGLEAWAGVPVLVMEYLAGGTLAGRLGSAWPWRDVLELGLALCDALVAMHGQGVVHRDVKPSNIGFATDETPKLLDFGLARLPEEVSEEDEGAVLPEFGAAESVPHVAGTLLYLPPEALRGVDPRETQDLWALAMTLYQMISGRHPLSGREVEALLRRGEMPAIPRLDEGSCPEAVAECLTRALDPDPAVRPGSAAAFRDELRKLSS